MNDRSRIESILERIDALREEVVSLMPEPEPIIAPISEPKSVVAQPKVFELPSEPSAFDRFVNRVGDWFAVRGDFAPEGMTREFAVATRWLTRVGALLLVGAMTYFLMLAINRGWIGPTQRVCSMMLWGLLGTVGGTWLKLRRANYAILGEVFAALGLVAFYLAFGLGHRYFNPPVIVSPTVAFSGLALATIVAGILAVRLKSLMIASLFLVGGFLVPSIAQFRSTDMFLVVYLAMLTLGGTTIAYLRQWTPLGFVALAVAFAMGHHELTLDSILLAQTLALTIFGAKRRNSGENGFCWAFVCLASLAWPSESDPSSITLAIASVVYAALAVGVRRRQLAAGTGAPVLISWSVLYAVTALLIKIMDALMYDWLMLVYALTAVLLGELGLRLKERTLEVFSLILLAILSLGFIIVAQYDYSTISMMLLSDYGYGFSLRALYFLPVVAASTYVAIRLTAPTRWLANGRRFFVALASFFLFVFVSAESGWFGKLYLPTLKTGLMTIVWAGTAFGLLTLGLFGRWKSVRFVGLGLLGLSVVKLLLIDTASLATPGRVSIFAAVGVLMIVGAFLYLKFKSLFENNK